MKTLGKKHCGTGGIIRNNKGQILLEKLSYKNYWSLPGGAIDDNESPKKTLFREFQEELGIEVEIKDLVF